MNSYLKVSDMAFSVCALVNLESAVCKSLIAFSSKPVGCGCSVTWRWLAGDRRTDAWSAAVDAAFAIQLNQHTLHCTDCRTVRRTLASASGIRVLRGRKVSSHWLIVSRAHRLSAVVVSHHSISDFLTVAVQARDSCV